MASIWFDLDGTLYELYKIPNWLERIEKKDWNVFIDGEPRKHHERIQEAIKALQAKGWKVGCITWSSKAVEGRDIHDIAEKKKEFVEKYFPELLENFHCLPYGCSKAALIRYSYGRGSKRETEGPNYLVDDNKDVRRDWREVGKDFGYKTINASRSFIRELEALAE